MSKTVSCRYRYMYHIVHVSPIVSIVIFSTIFHPHTHTHRFVFHMYTTDYNVHPLAIGLFLLSLDNYPPIKCYQRDYMIVC